MDYEEYIEIFLNGRGIPSHNPIPPGIFGYEEGEVGINPYVYEWDASQGATRRKTVGEMPVNSSLKQVTPVVKTKMAIHSSFILTTIGLVLKQPLS